MKFFEQAARYKAGDYYQLCDECGRKIRSSESRLRWDGLIVCPADFEVRHPQEVLNRAKTDRQSVPYPRPRPEPVYITPLADTVWMKEEDGTYMLDENGNRMEEE